MSRLFSKTHFKSLVSAGLCILGIVAVVLWALSIGPAAAGPAQPKRSSPSAAKPLTNAAQAGYVTYNGNSVSNNNNTVANFGGAGPDQPIESYGLHITDPLPQNNSLAHSPMPVPIPPKAEPVVPPADIPLPLNPLPCKFRSANNPLGSCQIFCPDGSVIGSCGSCGPGVVIPDMICPPSLYN